MQLFLLIVLSLVPGILWVWFFNSQDRYEREPPTLLIRTFIFGMLAVFPAMWIELPFRGLVENPANLWVRLYASILVVGLTEETVKFAAFALAVYGSRHFNEVMDGIVYAVTAALGFAALETLFYATTFGLEVAPVRGVVTSLAHASFSGIVGFYAGLVWMGRGHWTKALWALLAAATLHGLYDFLILGQVASPFVALLIIYGVYRFLASRIARAQRLSPYRDEGGPDDR